MRIRYNTTIGTITAKNVASAIPLKSKTILRNRGLESWTGLTRCDAVFLCLDRLFSRDRHGPGQRMQDCTSQAKK